MRNLPVILITLFLCILIGITILVSIEIRNRNIITNIENQLVKTDEEISKANEEIDKLHSYLKELEASDDIDKTEFVEIWKSLGTIRNNFLALGLGLHLVEEDICPEEVVNCEEEIP